MKQNIIILIVVMFIFITCKNITSEKQETLPKENDINQSKSLKIPLILAKSLEPQRKEFEKIVISALERIRIFAKQYNWENLTTESFMDSIMIFDSKMGFDTTLLILVGADKNMELPKSYSACLENRILMSVSPEIYSENYPEGIEDKYFEKLLTHEIAHRLHIRILKGNEEMMGPIWFYEGFAIFAADQLKKTEFSLDTNEIWETIENTERGSYIKYGFVFRYFTDKIGLQKMISKSSDKDFHKWLKTQ